MPAQRFTKAANTPKKRRTWDHVYQSAKSRGASPGSAIRQANSAVKRSSPTRSTKSSGYGRS